MKSEILEKEFGTWLPFMDRNNLTLLYDKYINELEVLYENTTCYPSIDKIFRAFRETDYDNCSCVLIGMDPYPGVYKNIPSACGLSFATENGFINPSLSIILDSLINNGLRNPNDPKDGRELINWSKQGMLLLNAALSVEAGKPGSHMRFWNDWTTHFITALSRQRKDIIFILLGENAKSFKPYIISDNYIEGPHPMVDRYRPSEKMFEKAQIFKKLNNKLQKKIIY